MGIVRYKNPSEYAFLEWMENYPESFHPLDMRRFYVFVKTIARYRSAKWLDRLYFERRILGHTQHFELEHIATFWKQLQMFMEFCKASALPLYTIDDLPRRGYYQRGVINDKMYEVEISEEGYNSPDGATKETLSKV